MTGCGELLLGLPLGLHLRIGLACLAGTGELLDIGPVAEGDRLLGGLLGLAELPFALGQLVGDDAQLLGAPNLKDKARS